MKREGITRIVARMAYNDRRIRREAALFGVRKAIAEKRERRRDVVRRCVVGLAIFALVAAVVAKCISDSNAWTAFKKDHGCVAVSKNDDVITMVATSDGTNIILIPMIVPGTTNGLCNDGKLYEGY